MSGGTISSLLGLITAAVTPVVMISAAASLIIGINQKHVALADRLRTLAAAFREPDTTAARRQNIYDQIVLFHRRYAWVTYAHRWLYAAVVCFIGTVLNITLSARSVSWEWLTLALFIIGIVIMLGAVAAELIEIHWAKRTVELELQDILAYPPTVSTSVGSTG